MADAPVAVEEGPFRPGDVISDRYQIDAWLKSGGVGAVYAATHRFTHQRVAIKALHKRAGDHHDRMRQEAQALAVVRHAFVVPIQDGGVTPDGVVWYAMERVARTRGSATQSLCSDAGFWL